MKIYGIYDEFTREYVQFILSQLNESDFEVELLENTQNYTVPSFAIDKNGYPSYFLEGKQYLDSVLEWANNYRNTNATID